MPSQETNHYVKFDRMIICFIVGIVITGCVSGYLMYNQTTLPEVVIEATKPQWQPYEILVVGRGTFLKVSEGCMYIEGDNPTGMQRMMDCGVYFQSGETVNIDEAHLIWNEYYSTHERYSG